MTRYFTAGATPTTYAHDTGAVCGRCPRCHPGRQWGGDERCRVTNCRCHRTEER